MAGDVATAGTAGTDVTRVDAEQQDQSEPELQAAENGVTSPPAAPDEARSVAAPAPGDPQPSAGEVPADDGAQDAGPADTGAQAAAEPADGGEAAASPADTAPAEGTPPGKATPPARTRSAKNRPAKNPSGRTRSGSSPARGVIGGVLPVRTGSSGDTSAAAAGTAAVRRRLARLGAPRGGGANPVLEPLIKTVRATHPKADVRLIERAYEVAAQQHAGQFRKSGDPFITHPLAVTTILAELGMNSETLCAALLHDTVEDTEYTLAELRKEFGDDVATLVDGVTKLDKVKYGDAAQAETVRKMVVAMSRDIRVLVIKLADRLHNMRTLRYLPREKQEQKSREVLEIFAPLAHRLGMNNVKWELEDLAFSTLFPKRYDEIARLVSERAPRRDVFMQDVIELVSADMGAAK
ncbi:MAG TPA: HD domain-containing protein, partial [Streptosporangiaceae bacterium]|nr:HD domain-containing protein [Streptosporangiaceae bacterium]